VSLSADGQRVLVTPGRAAATEQGLLLVTTTTYLVDGTLTDEPKVRRVDVEGALPWLNPVAGSDTG
jgi:hypothetical protein